MQKSLHPGDTIVLSKTEYLPINPTTFNPYSYSDYDYNSSNVTESTIGVAFKNQLSASRYSGFPMGYINVLGNNAAAHASIGVTYAHSQLTGSYSVSFSTSGPSISVKPALSFDTITATASIDF